MDNTIVVTKEFFHYCINRIGFGDLNAKVLNGGLKLYWCEFKNYMANYGGCCTIKGSIPNFTFNLKQLDQVFIHEEN